MPLFGKGQPGQKGKLSASDFNAIMQAALRGTQGERSIPEGRADNRSEGIIQVRNDSGEDLDRYDVVGLDEPIILPADSETEFKRAIAFSVILPEATAHEGAWAILLEPLKDGKIGPALAAGVCQVRVTGAAADFAEIQDGSTVLLAGTSGSARLIWPEPGSGERWGIVRIGAGSVIAADTCQEVVVSFECDEETQEITYTTKWLKVPASWLFDTEEECDA